MKPVKLETSKAPQPGGWYSQAFRVGNLIYTAGITAHDPVTGELVASGDIAGQTRQILRNMKGILEDHGSDLEHEAYKEFFPEDPPARSTMQVGKFNHGMVIEIEAIAAVKE